VNSPVLTPHEPSRTTKLWTLISKAALPGCDISSEIKEMLVTFPRSHSFYEHSWWPHLLCGSQTG